MPYCLVKSSINIDETFDVPHIVQPGETLSSTGLTSRPGGKGANVSAAIGLAGAKVILSGAVGKDATWPLDELKTRNVDIQSVEILQEDKTGRAFIQIGDDGENSIVLLKGANYAATASSDPKTVFGSTPEKVTHLVVQNEIPFDTTLAYLKHAKVERVTTIFNPSPMPDGKQLQSFPWDCVNVLIVNEGEGAELIKALGNGSITDSTDDDARSKVLLEALSNVEALKGIQWLVLTRGGKGVMALVKGKFVKVNPFRPSQVRDTTGAGDTFAGNLVAALMGLNVQAQEGEEEYEHEVLTWACKAASVACETVGAMRSIPCAEDVKKRFAQ